MTDDAQSIYQKARKAFDAGEFAEAAALFQKSIILMPHFKAFELLGECFIKLDRLTEAVGPLAAATILNRQVRAPSLLCEVFFQLGERTAAARFCRLALKRDPHNRKALAVQKKLN